MMSVSVNDISDYLCNLGISNCIEGDTDIRVTGFSSLFNYKPETMTFVVPERQVMDYISNCKKGDIALIIMSSNELIDERFQCVLRVKDPRKAFFKVVEYYFNKTSDESITGISSNSKNYYRQSYISDKAIIGKNVKIGIGCVIEGNVEIGDNTEVHHNVVIRTGSKIGKNCTIFSGTVIGERGFNYSTDDDGTRHMLKHYGGVVIEDNVHIGDNCCIIQGAIDDTVIKRGAKLNTMVHVAHNVIIGENTIITAPTHICGSVIIGRNCHVAASIIRNQVSVGDNAILGLGCVVVKNVEAGETVIGNPARPFGSIT
jgi:UDP-3-O-[3-hydroxymyristoyl] glucosamine N-acyltransferase